jgi:phage recombination protein Bet
MATMAERFGVPEKEMLETLKATAFKQKDGQVSDAQMTALLIVANQYGLNPWTKEIYAYPDKGGIVPVVGVDGWARIINENPQLDGIEFNHSEKMVDFKGKKAHEWIECIITRKDRAKPTVVREYFDEVSRDLTYANPWNTHPKRMHRHKALIQCSRVAFGFVGIYDEDEAERIVEKDITPAKPAIVMPQAAKPAQAPAAEAKPEPAVIEGEFIPAKAETVDTATGEIKPGTAASANQLKVIRARLATANVTEQALCDQFLLETLEQLPASAVANASKWIKEQVKA